MPRSQTARPWKRPTTTTLPTSKRFRCPRPVRLKPSWNSYLPVILKPEPRVHRISSTAALSPNWSKKASSSKSGARAARSEYGDDGVNDTPEQPSNHIGGGRCQVARVADGRSLIDDVEF